MTHFSKSLYVRLLISQGTTVYEIEHYEYLMRGTWSPVMSEVTCHHNLPSFCCWSCSGVAFRQGDTKGKLCLLVETSSGSCSIVN